ncbi:IclR family transcriptional regulator [Bacillus sp. M6-12]|uniref:IclR family transcriptional regulator n=1 Tax=Bacillus sp. M6-12 TaxID=2054166 RepID=UPI000C77478E|nr:IclR family transcriptional regulator [Bacillus sp. M6-12]PLS18607.1 IclR family transcriptional regulator [Bacillus sp. M6-12]
MRDQRDSSLSNALRVLKIFSMDKPELGITEIAGILQISKSTVHRLLSTMTSEGFVYKDPITNLYSLGTSVLSLTNIVRTQIPFLKESTPILNLLTEKTGETSHLGILERKHIIYLEKIECEFPVQLHTHLGKRHPIHSTSTGQIILAFQNEGYIHSLLPKELDRYTPRTITSHYELLEKLDVIRSQYYVICDQEFLEGIIAVGVPVFNEKDQVIAAISIAGPVHRMKDKLKNPKFLEDIKLAGQKISEMIKERKKKGI